MTSCACGSRPRPSASASSAPSPGSARPGGLAMGRSDQVLRRVRFAYERTRILDGARGLAIAAGISILAIGLHRITSTSWLVAAVLAASLGALGWRGGALRRGAFAGVLAGLPTMIVPSIVFTLSQHGHCAGCGTAAAWPCLLSCFVT